MEISPFLEIEFHVSVSKIVKKIDHYMLQPDFLISQLSEPIPDRFCSN